jgi:integrase
VLFVIDPLPRNSTQHIEARSFSEVVSVENSSVWKPCEGLPHLPLCSPIFRSIPKGAKDGPLESATLAPMGVWWPVKEYAEGIGLKNLAPHDLRRTCAKLCRKSGGDLEQIQMLLGHASIQTTEKYLGMQQNLVEAVNDKLGIVDAEGE